MQSISLLWGMMRNHAHRESFTLLVTGSSLPAPTTSLSGGRVDETSPPFRPRRLLLAFESDDPTCTVQGPVQVWAYFGDRWRSMGAINQGQQIDATAGLEEEIVWNGAARIAVSAPSVSGGTVTVNLSRVELL